MKKASKDVKSGGKVIGKVEIPVYETLKEAIDALTEKDVLSLVNRQNASDITNTYRAAKTATASPIAQLGRLAKKTPELNKAIESLLAKYTDK
jgi:hypothetical protein